jgi:hypothetical protein
MRKSFLDMFKSEKTIRREEEEKAMAERTRRYIAAHTPSARVLEERKKEEEADRVLAAAAKEEQDERERRKKEKRRRVAEINAKIARDKANSDKLSAALKVEREKAAKARAKSSSSESNDDVLVESGRNSMYDIDSAVLDFRFGENPLLVTAMSTPVLQATMANAREVDATLKPSDAELRREKKLERKIKASKKSASKFSLPDSDEDDARGVKKKTHKRRHNWKKTLKMRRKSTKRVKHHNHKKIHKSRSRRVKK